MTDGNPRMLEIVSRISGHSEPLHHPPRRLVERRRERDDLVQVELRESVFECGLTGLGRVAVPPVLAREPPADLDRRREVRLEARTREADEADEARAAGNLDGPQTPALLLEVPTDVLRECVARVA